MVRKITEKINRLYEDYDNITCNEKDLNAIFSKKLKIKTNLKCYYNNDSIIVGFKIYDYDTDFNLGVLSELGNSVSIDTIDAETGLVNGEECIYSTVVFMVNENIHKTIPLADVYCYKDRLIVFFNDGEKVTMG